MNDKLKYLLSGEGEEISALLNVLSKQEIIKLSGYFDTRADVEHDLDDAKIKFLALNALFVYIKNNPSIEKDLRSSDINIEKLAEKIYELASILYESDATLQHYFYKVSYAVLADKVTLLSNTNQPQTNGNFSEELLYFFTQLAYLPRTQDNLDERRDSLSSLQAQFKHFQIPENIQNQEQVFHIIAFSNLVDLAQELQNYLLEGTGTNISTNINNKVASAIKIFQEINNRDWELVCSLLRFSLHKLYDNSIWTYANRFPFFKNFVKKQISTGAFLFSLFPSQKSALNDVLSTRKSTVISMPTSSGKTLLAELKILYTRSLYQNECVCAYVVPTNALINQTLKQLQSRFPDWKIEKLLPYNHFDEIEHSLTDEVPDILVCTPEKLNFLLRSEEAEFLNKLRLVVIDEAHNISDASRGSIWEFLLANLKQDDQQLSYLLLTPFIRNRDELANWLGHSDSASISIEWTPTKQYVAYHELNIKKTESSINYLPSARNSIVQETISIDLGINPQDRKNEFRNLLGEVEEKKLEKVSDAVRNSILIEKFSKQSGCILVLHKGPGYVETLANKLSHIFNFSNEGNVTDIDYAKDVIRLELGEKHSLIDLLDYGIAFHHAQLSPLVKETIENLVINDAIKVLVATTTLAQGMNFPIKTVIFETLTVGGGIGTRELSHSGFWNIAGRAGRAFKDTEGHIILGAKGKNTENQLRCLITSDIEETVSSLKVFFEQLSDEQEINYQFIKDNPVAQNFLHYLNHLMNISHQYNLDQVSRQDITNILTNSLYFKQNEFSEGFLETQEKVVNFSNRYISSIKEKKVGQLKLADALGITDISLSRIIGFTQEDRPLLSDCINQNNLRSLTTIVNAMHKIPELIITLNDGDKPFNPELIASILLGWINGDSIAEIGGRHQLSTNKCSGYIFSRLKNYIPWGMAIYQKISNDENKLLPSYAFYGVKDEKSVKLAHIGVPRFALPKVKNFIHDDSLYGNLKALRQHVKSQQFSLEEDVSKNNIVNQIIKNSIL